MEVTLRPDLQRFVDERVQAGRYRSANEVISSALEQLREQENEVEEDFEELRAEIEIGMEQLRRGESAPLDADELKRKVRERAARLNREM